jgi:dTDP-glucose 4,6-dehydratase
VSGRVTQVFIERAMAGKPLAIHGDPAATHDFTYIDDLVQGLRLVLEARQDGIHTYNVTGECATSLADLATIVTRVFPTEVTQGPADSDKPARGTMSCKRIRDELGYEPRWDIATGMGEYMDWYKQLGKSIQIGLGKAA